MHDCASILDSVAKGTDSVAKETCFSHGASLHRLSFSSMIITLVVCSHCVGHGFKTDVYLNMECTYTTYFRHGEATPIVCCASTSLPRESVFSFSCCNCLLWPCLKEERELPTLLYIMYKLFEKESAKSKYR